MVNIRGSGSLSCHLGGASGRLVLRCGRHSCTADSFAGHSALYFGNFFMVSIVDHLMYKCI